jgi:hypothetical protein
LVGSVRPGVERANAQRAGRQRIHIALRASRSAVTEVENGNMGWVLLLLLFVVQAKCIYLGRGLSALEVEH